MVLEKFIRKIIAKHGLATDFSPAALQEADRLPAEIPPHEWKRRVDLTARRFVTIDGETARDFDDAVYVERQGRGWRLWVAIADVSAFVPEESALDREAVGRATSVYFPGSCIPMLPERLSNDLCSLRPHEPRLTFTAELELDQNGGVVVSKFYRSVIRSAARLTYTEVDRAAYQKDPAMRRDLKVVVDLLDEMAALMKVLRRRRMERGSLDFDLPEPFITLNIEDGTPEAILKAPRTEAHMLIEEFMILANEAVAGHVEKQGGPMVYRVHGTPEMADLKELAALAHSIGLALPARGKIRPADLVALLTRIKGRPEERLMNILTLRSLPRAVYATDNIGHFGLASPCYTHFTSPIRRYPDLAVHRILSGLIAGKGVGRYPPIASLKALAKHCSENETAAMKAERDVVHLYQTYFMRDKVGKTFGGRVSGVTEFGIFVELDDFFVEGLVHKRSLSDDRYRFIPAQHALVGARTKRKFRVGVPVTIRLAGTNLEKSFIDFALV